SRRHHRGFLLGLFGGSIRQCFCVTTIFSFTLKLARSILVDLLGKITSAAFWTFLRNRFITHREFAGRIPRTTVKRAALASFDDDLSLAALGAGDASSFLLDVFALRIIRTRGERSVSALFEYKVFAALRTRFFENNVGRRELAALLNLPSCLAFGITRAREELPEPPSLHSHPLAAILASLFSGFRVSFFAGLVVNLRQIASRLALGVVDAREELTKAAELLGHRRAAVLTLLVGDDLLPLHVAHVKLRVIQVLGELLVELRQRRGPYHFAVFDLVQLFFHMSGVRDVEQIVEALDQQIADDYSEFGWKEAAFPSLGIFAVLNHGHDGRISRRPSDSLLFERLH